jgi:DNA-binding CsgD family transcriptional regulator
MLKTILNYIQRHVFLRNLGLILVAMLLIAECSRVDDGMVRGSKSINAILDKAELLLDENPVLTDSLLNTIDPSAIKGKENKARYALFYTAAEYKNRKRATSDSLIMVAVRFYSIGSKMDYRFLSNYYLGCVYQNLGQNSNAAAAFANAEQLATYIDNDFWKGLLYFRLGYIFIGECDYHRAEEYFLKSKTYFERVGNEQDILYATLYLGKTRNNLQEYNSADSLLRIVEMSSSLLGDNELTDQCVYERMSCLVNMGEPDSATHLLNKYYQLFDSTSKAFGYLEMMAQYYNSVKDHAKSELFLERAWNCDLSEDDSIYLYYVSSLLAQSKGETELALDFFQKYTSLQNKSLRSILRQPILAAQKEQYRIMAENELLKYRHTRLTLILCVVIFLLILVIVLVTYHYKKKRMKEQLYESLSVVEELSSKIEDLRSQVRVQFHERHDISNRLYSMYFDSESQDKITKQQLNVTINSLIKDYTAPESIRKLDRMLNESYDGIMERLVDPEIGLTDKEVELFRYSIAGLSSKSVSVIIKESPQNIYQIKSRLLKKVRRNSEELWSRLNMIW